MTLELTADERTEVENLGAECEDPLVRRRHLAELIRLRALARELRRHRPPRLHPIVARLLDLLPRDRAGWERLAADSIAELEKP